MNSCLSPLQVCPYSREEIDPLRPFLLRQMNFLRECMQVSGQTLHDFLESRVDILPDARIDGLD